MSLFNCKVSYDKISGKGSIELFFSEDQAKSVSEMMKYFETEYLIADRGVEDENHFIKMNDVEIWKCEILESACAKAHFDIVNGNRQN